MRLRDRPRTVDSTVRNGEIFRPLPERIPPAICMHSFTMHRSCSARPSVKGTLDSFRKHRGRRCSPPFRGGLADRRGSSSA